MPYILTPQVFDRPDINNQGRRQNRATPQFASCYAAEGLYVSWRVKISKLFVLGLEAMIPIKTACAIKNY
jgi:hypothetical protein